jgi:hypothetical protein
MKPKHSPNFAGKDDRAQPKPLWCPNFAPKRGSTRKVWVGLYHLLRQNLGNAPASSMASSWLGCKVSQEDRKIEKMSKTAIHGIESFKKK